MLGMIYLRDNPLLREPLAPEHLKARLLGHWGQPGPGVHLGSSQSSDQKNDLDMIYLSGPGHGAPGVLAPVYLEGSYSSVYPDRREDEQASRSLTRQAAALSYWA
jgi:xylulose-5-phosphate/fructose-6-phosphate phosphoketolase